MGIHRVVENQKEQVFKYLYAQGFKSPNYSHNPPDVYIQTNSDVVEVMYAGYAHDLHTFYLQFATRFDEGDDGQQLFREFLDHIGTEYNFVMCAIENGNLPPLFRCLKTGFKIIGTRTTTDGIVLVEMIKKMR